MKATAQKIKKLRTRQVYGFKKNQFNGASGDPTYTSITTGSGVMVV